MCKRKREEAYLECLQYLNEELLDALSNERVVFIEITLVISPKRAFNHVSTISSY